MLKAIQHNCGKTGETFAAILESAVEEKADVVLVQEPPARWGRSHPGFDFLWTVGRAMKARRKDSDWTFTTEDNLTRGARGDVQALAAGRRG